MAGTEPRIEPELHGGRYRLDRVLGTGGMATVWLGHDRRLERPVAIKVMADTLAADSGYVQRFEREARTAAGLSHPGLVDIFDFSAEGERPFLVMEYVPGGTLADRLGDSAAVAIPAEALARGLLGALAHVHGAGIVHRDIKPANVLLDDHGRVRLTDFGIAHPDDATHLTMTGQVVGTLKYLAPEVARGEPATARSDLYSCGVLLRECGGQEVSLAALVDSLTADDPARRPRSAQAALGELDDLARTPATAAMPATAETERLARPDRTPRGDPTAPTSVVTGPTRATAKPPRARRQRSRRAWLLALLLVAAAAIAVAIAVGGGGASRAPSREAVPSVAPKDASLDRQLDGLERIVRRAP